MKGPIYTSVTKIWEDDEGIAHTEFLPGARVNCEAAEEHFEACRQLTGNEKKPVMVDLKNLVYADRGARQCFSSDASTSITKASAVIVDSAIGQVVGGFFMGLNRPPVPIKLFTSREEAMKWLREFKK